MKKSRFLEQQVAFALRHVESGISIKDITRTPARILVDNSSELTIQIDGLMGAP